MVTAREVRIHTAVKRIWGERLTTVFPRQGHYAHDPDLAALAAPDVTVEPIGDLLKHDLTTLCLRASVRGARHS